MHQWKHEIKSFITRERVQGSAVKHTGDLHSQPTCSPPAHHPPPILCSRFSRTGSEAYPRDGTLLSGSRTHTHGVAKMGCGGARNPLGILGVDAEAVMETRIAEIRNWAADLIPSQVTG